MSHWLEEAERKKAEEKEADFIFERIEVKREAIKKNYEANKELYEDFIKQLVGLANRVNDLPVSYRESFGKINFRKKDSKLRNHLYYLSSSKRVYKWVFQGLLAIWKKSAFKHIRVSYLTISREMGMLDIELKENLLLRKRMKSDGDEKSRKKYKKSSKHKKDLVFRLDLKEVNEATAVEIIDWLAFKKDMESISFYSKICHSLSS